MATVNADDTGYTATSDSSASSWQHNDSDMLTGNHLGIAEFSNSVKGISGVNNSYMTVTSATCYVYPREDVNKTFTVCVANSHANKGSSHPTSNTSSGFTINASNNEKVAVDVTALMNNINFSTASIYVHFKSSWGTGFRRKSIKCPQLAITAALTYTNVGSPGTPSVSASGITCSGSWSAASGGHNTSVASYTYVWNTSATGTSGTQTTTTSRSCSFSGNYGTTYYLHVKANSSPSGHDSGWVHSSAVTTASRTNVSVGSLTLSAGIGSMTLSWGAGSGGTGTSIARYRYGYGASGASAPSSTWTTTGTSATISSLAQNTSYVFFVKAESNPSGYDSSYKSKSGTTDYYGTLPNPSISVSVSNTSATVSASGAGAHNVSVASYSYGYATSGSSPTTTGGPTFSGLTAGTTYYFFARSNSSPSGYNSGWARSSAYTIGAHPSVATGDIITKGQMDTLRSWKSNSPTAVSQGGIIYASTASTYRSASAGGSITASWYNGA